MKPEIRHIVFDIGKVLIHYDPNLPFSRLIPDEAERRWFFENVCTHDWNLEQDRGRTWAEAEVLAIEAYPEREEQIRAFRKHWHEMVPFAYDGSVAIMRKLIADGHDVTMLTNFADDTFAQAQTMYDFLHAPRGVTVSGRVGLIKPDAAIYETHARAFDLDPKASLFIDDSAANVAGAQACGWQAVLFTGADKLRQDLAEYGIAA
ncbi:2-haloacid dehalogenase [Ensifer adhaerens]|nr:2-haloacid dehalogenase [Ensifer adhaerens]